MSEAESGRAESAEEVADGEVDEKDVDGRVQLLVGDVDEHHEQVGWYTN